MKSDVAIEVSGLAKTYRVRERAPGMFGTLKSLFSAKYRDVEALEEVDFSIKQGERVAFIGPNGAGKSTTIKILTGILHPSSGRASVLGFVPWEERTKLGYHIGAVFGQRSQLWYHLPARDSFDLLSKVYELDRSEYRRRLGELVEAFEIASIIEQPVRQLSLGQRMRCEIVASLLHRPRMIFLDEPTIGLDVTAKSVIRDIVRERSERDGCTVMLTSHDTGDMERVCDRVIVINHGRILLDKPVADLRKGYIKRKLVTLVTSDEQVELELPGVDVVEHVPYKTTLEVDVTQTDVEAVMQRAMQATRLRDITVEDPPMEEIVKAIYEEQKEVK